MASMVGERPREKEVREAFRSMQRYLRDVTGLDTTKDKVEFGDPLPNLRISRKSGPEGMQGARPGRMTLEQMVSSTTEIFSLAAGLRDSIANSRFAAAAEVISQQDNLEKLYFDILSYANNQLFGALCAYGQAELSIPGVTFQYFASLLLNSEARGHLAAVGVEAPGFAESFDIAEEVGEAELAIKKNAVFPEGSNELFDENMLDYLVEKDGDTPDGLGEKGVESYWFLVGDVASLALLNYKSNVEKFLQMNAEALGAMEKGETHTLRLVPDAYSEEDEDED